MSRLYVHVTVDNERTARLLTGALVARLRDVADQVEQAPGPIDITVEWPDIEAWPTAPAKLTAAERVEADPTAVLDRPRATPSSDGYNPP